MKVELQKPGQEVDESKQGKVVKKTDAAGVADEVSAHSWPVNFNCPHCQASLTGIMETNPQWFRCPDCGQWILVTA